MSRTETEGLVLLFHLLPSCTMSLDLVWRLPETSDSTRQHSFVEQTAKGLCSLQSVEAYVLYQGCCRRKMGFIISFLRETGRAGVLV